MRDRALRLCQDKQFVAALLAGPLFWGVLWYIRQPEGHPVWPLRFTTTFFWLVLAYPLLEEIVFRGAVQGGLLRLKLGRTGIAGFSLANLFTSLIFAGLHLFHHPALWALLVIAPSLVFGYFREKYGSLLPSITLHVFYNLGYFWLFESEN